MQSLSDRVAMLLARKAGFRPADLARVCKVSTASVADWQSGKTKSMKSEAARLAAAAFGCDQNWLSHGIGHPNWQSTSQVITPPTGAVAQSAPTLATALPVVLDALARATARTELRQLLPMLVDTDAPAYRQRLGELLSPVPTKLSGLSETSDWAGKPPNKDTTTAQGGPLEDPNRRGTAGQREPSR